MKKLLKPLVGFISPRFHAAAPTASTLVFGSTMSPAGRSSWPTVQQVLLRVFSKPAIAVDAPGAGRWNSLHDEQSRQADGRMAQVMAETRMF